MTVWMYWEGKEPADWIKACQQTVYTHCDDVRLLGPDSPEVQPVRTLKGFDKLCMAHKADMIRAYLLATYGGFWIDSDCVVFRPLKPIFDLVDQHGFVISRQYDGDLSSAFVGCTPGHPIAVAWHEQQKRVLAGGSYGWLSFGAHAIWNAIQTTKANWYRLEHWVIQPVWWSDPERFHYKRDDADHAKHLNADSYTYMLSNNMNQSVKDDLLDPKTFFSYCLRESQKMVGTGPITIKGQAVGKRVLIFRTYAEDHWTTARLRDYWSSRASVEVRHLRGYEDWQALLPAIRRADHVYLWHGSEHGSMFVAEVCRQHGKPFTFYEMGWFPQAESMHFDPNGIVGRSSLCGSLGWVNDEHLKKLADFRVSFLKGRKWKGKADGPVVVPLQLEHDAAVYWHAPEGLRTMAELVDHVCATYPDREVVVCKHPHEANPKLNAGRWRFGTNPTSVEMEDAGLVVGLTSTCLLEAAMKGCPVVALGDCPLRHHQHDVERLLAAYVARQVQRGTKDLTPWLKAVGVVL